MKATGKFLNHIHYFRAFAIINIMVLHLWHIPESYQKYRGCNAINIAREVAFHDSTIYFIFISGFLFYYLSNKFKLFKYYKSKIFNVLLPYVFITLVVNALFIINQKCSITDYFKYALWSLVDGTAQTQYWYIPFISLVYLISPIFLMIQINTFRIVVIVLSLLPLLGTRTENYISFFQYVYFFPAYLLGIYAAMDYVNFISIIRSHMFVILSLLIVSSLMLANLNGKPCIIGLVNITESLFYIQKISICFVSLIVLIRFEDKKIVLLDYFATYSFAIYFTHTLIGNTVVNAWYYDHLLSKLPELILPLSIIYVVAISFTTLLVCITIKQILGKRSRYFIGA